MQGVPESDQILNYSKMPHRVFSRQTNWLILNAPVLQVLLRVNRRANKGAPCSEIENNELQSFKVSNN